MTGEVGPGKSRNKILAVSAAVMAVFPLFIGLSSISRIRADEWWFPAMFIVPGLLLVAWAIWLWRKEQGRATTIEFTETGIVLKRLREGEVRREIAIDWKNVRELRDLTVGRGDSGIQILLDHDGAKRAGLVLETTRKDAPNFLVKRTVMIAASDIDTPRRDVIERMISAARAAGCLVERARSRHYFVMSVDRWIVTSK